MTPIKSAVHKTLMAIAAITSVTSLSAQAEYQYGFANIYGDYLDWGHGFKDLEKAHPTKNGNRPHHYAIGVDGGAGFSWGEMYGFIEYENLNKSSDEHRIASKITGHYRLMDSNFTLYGQIYDIRDDKLRDEQNRVIGLGYLGLQGEGWWFKPWIGIHNVDQSRAAWGEKGYSGSNGGMAGWVAGYNFTLAGLPLMLTNWNEIEFKRDETYAKQNGGKTGYNGGTGLWYNVTEKFYVGIQHRYFRNKLGWEGYGDAMIYRVGYHF